MNNEEIKKALECCADKDGASCKHCPYNSDCSKGGIRMLTDSLALINRQQADIERLKYLLEREEKATQSFSKQCYKDGIKEFAEKVKNYVKTHCNPYGKPIFDYDTSLKILKYLDNLLAEMVGEQNA